MSCACNKRIKEKNAKLATMNYKSHTIAAAAVEAREQRRFRTPKYTMAASNSGTVTTQISWNPCLSYCCSRAWDCKVGGVVKPAAGDKSEVESVKRHDNEVCPPEDNAVASVAASSDARGGLAGRNDDEAGPSGTSASVAASVEVTGTGLVNGRPVINRLYIEQLFNSSDDSNDDWWNPDEGFHEACIEGKNNKVLSMNVLSFSVARNIVTLFLGAFCFCSVILT